MLLRGAVAVASHAQFFVWLEKAIEFFVCYVAQSLPEESGVLCEKVQNTHSFTQLGLFSPVSGFTPLIELQE